MKAAIFKRFEQSCWISNKSSSVCLQGTVTFMPETETFLSGTKNVFTHTFLAALTDEIDFEIYLNFLKNIFKPAHPSSCTPVIIKTPGVWVFLWSSGRTPSILHFIVCLSPAVSLQQCHSSLRCISSLQLCLVTGMKLGLHATVICWRKLQAIRSWTLRTSRLRPPPTPTPG